VFCQTATIYLYAATTGRLEKVVTYVGDLDSKKRRPVMERVPTHLYAASYLLFVREAA